MNLVQFVQTVIKDDVSKIEYIYINLEHIKYIEIYERNELKTFIKFSISWNNGIIVDGDLESIASYIQHCNSRKD